ncbi:MAG: transcription antitermination factor NusB, partial [Oscillospiraceae bacterium]
MKSSRQVAAEALARCERGGYSQLVLDAAIRRAGLLPRDAAFAGALFYGSLERKLTLDHCIARYARHPLTPEVQAILRCAVYQLLYLDSVPPRAAVDEAVDLVRTMRQSSASGMVNGILRAFLRDGCAVPPTAGVLATLRVRYSCAEPLIARLIDWYGESTAERVLASSIGRPPIFLRVNTLKTDAAALCARLEAEGCRAAPGPFADCLTGTGDLAHTAAHADGWFHIQDAASQFAALTLDARPGERVLDVCAAPGSKSFVAAQRMNNTGELLACDLAAARLQLVEKNAARLGIRMLRTLENDGAIDNP